jgi:YkoY family integral membrane protein
MTIFGQVFSWIDIPIVLLILLIELLLASDNAAAIGLVVKRLPEEKKEKALFAGLVSAFFLRAIGVGFTAYLIYLFWVQLIGGIYLVYIAWHFLCGSKKAASSSFSPTSYWKAVVYIELIDLLFAIDSILGAFALASLYYPYDQITSKLWVIYLGGVLGVVAVRFVTKKFITFLNKHKQIETIAFLVIGWMGIKLIFEGAISFFSIDSLRHASDLFFWAGTLIIVIVGFIFVKIKKTINR